MFSASTERGVVYELASSSHVPVQVQREEWFITKPAAKMSPRAQREERFYELASTSCVPVQVQREEWFMS